MGTFLCEHRKNPHFERMDELKSRLIEVLLDLGEVGYSEVNIYNRKAYLLRINELSRPDKDGFIELSFNRYERDAWEPTYVNFDKEKFKGICARAIGSKIGYREHYDAMLVSRVLCECYSNGTYIVYGDVGYYGIINALAYIGKKYEFDLVEKFIENRCDINNFEPLDENENVTKQFWGIRGEDFYFRKYILANDFQHWIKELCDEEDLKKAEKGDDIEYIKSEYYLSTRLLHHMMSQDLKTISNIDEKAIYNLFFKYCSMNDESDLSQYLENMPEDIVKYKEYYYSHLKILYYYFADIDSIEKTISFIIPDITEIVKKVKEDFWKYLISDDYRNNLSKDEVDIGVKIVRKKLMHSPNSDKTRMKKICDDVRDVISACNDDNKDLYFDKGTPAEELYYCTGKTTEFSQELINEVERVFSRNMLDKFVRNWKNEVKTNEEIYNRLFDITDILEKNNTFMNEDFFYKMINNNMNQELSFRLDLLWFMLNELDNLDDQFMANWVIEIDYLYERFVLPKTCFR